MQKLQQKKLSLSNTSKFSKYSHLGIYGNSNESSLLLFDCLWKVKAKYNVLCSDALAKFRNARGASRHLVLIGNCRNCSYML